MKKLPSIDWTTESQVIYCDPLPDWRIVEIETAKTDSEGRVRVFGMAPPGDHPLCIEICRAGAAAIIRDALAPGASTVRLRHGWMHPDDYSALPEFEGW